VPAQLGVVVEIWRYPVKSLRGETVASIRVGYRGIEHDRFWSIRGHDGRFGSGKTTHRFRHMPGLLSMQSFVDASGAGFLCFSDGHEGPIDDPNTAHRVAKVVGEDVDIAVETETSHLDDSPVHLLSVQSLSSLAARLGAQVDRRRFRPNILVDISTSDDRPEDAWIDTPLRIGSVLLRVTHRTVRCVMVTQPQAELPFEPAVIKELEANNEMCLGVYARVEQPGTVSIGDEIYML
jgi:uncharacterized protein YcbX